MFPTEPLIYHAGQVLEVEIGLDYAKYSVGAVARCPLNRVTIRV